MLVTIQISFAGTSESLNVLLIVVDDLRPEIGAYGNRIIKTPNIDNLARQGIRFDRAYVQQATCLVSRASFFSGLRPDSMGLNGNIDLKRLRNKAPERVFFPQHFKNNGYYTASFGKIYHRNESDVQSWDIRGENTKGLYCAPENAAYGWKSLGPPTESADVPDDCYRDGKVTEQVIGELRKLDGKRFFLAAGFFKPHLPFAAPKRYWDLYTPGDIQSARRTLHLKDAPSFALTNFPELRAFAGVPQTGLIPDSMAYELIHGYYASVSYADAQVGRVLAELDRLDLRKNTIVVLIGDHGWKLGEYDSWCKQTNFELDTRAPLIISVPGVAHRNVSSESIVEFIDIFPTIAEIAGLPEPEAIDGKSFAALIQDPQRPFKQAAYSQFWRPGGVMGYTMRTERYRYTQWLRTASHEVLATELYDHATDPDETINISRQVSDILGNELANKLQTGVGLAKAGQE